VTFQGEGGQDAGGLYRDTLSHVCAELQHEHLLLHADTERRVVFLLTPTPNNRERLGEAQERFLPSPSARSPQQISQLEFLGRLLGVAIRSEGRTSLNLDLSELVWRMLVNDASLQYEAVAAWRTREAIPADAMRLLRRVDAACAEQLLRFRADDSSVSWRFPSLDTRLVDLR
ncbi:MAG: hypothetical protein MHM6MM_009595, partial [Cercozoa sp. M6MM]